MIVLLKMQGVKYWLISIRFITLCCVNYFCKRSESFVLHFVLIKIKLSYVKYRDRMPKSMQEKNVSWQKQNHFIEKYYLLNIAKHVCMLLWKEFNCRFLPHRKSLVSVCLSINRMLYNGNLRVDSKHLFSLTSTWNLYLRKHAEIETSDVLERTLVLFIFMNKYLFRFKAMD